MQTELLEVRDVPLIASEILVAIGLAVAVLFAMGIRKKHPSVTSRGWDTMVVGLVFLLAHAVFDVLDTLKLGDLTVDILNVADGLAFVLGLMLMVVGILQIAAYGAEQWGLE